MDKVFVDADIILDVIQDRRPHSKHAVALLTLIEKGVVKGHVSSLIFSNLFYILRKLKSAKHAVDILRKFKSLFKVLAVNEKIVEMALSSSFRDFEDAIQYYTAMENKIDYLVTRNKKDYKEKGLVVCNAGEYIKLKAIVKS